jgi:hypothetical protein
MDIKEKNDCVFFFFFRSMIFILIQIKFDIEINNNNELLKNIWEHKENKNKNHHL